MKVVGTNTIGYAQERNFCGLPFRNYRFEKRQNLYKVPAFLYEKATGRSHYFFWNTFLDFNLNRVSLFHFFNALSCGAVPWVTTFETYVPRWGNHMRRRTKRKGLELVAHDSCRRLIALSECSARIQRAFLDDGLAAYAGVIDDKMTVLHPPQRTLIPGLEAKKPPGEITFTFVGADFFRKGGREILAAFDTVYQKGYRDWRLHIVSRMQYGDYATATTKADVAYALRLIGKYPQHIRHTYAMPNDEVLALLVNSHVGLLPTYADTYGYSVLESQAAGCPVVTTDVRALPEINDDEAGWLIRTPIDELGIAPHADAKDRVAFSRRVTDQLVPVLTGILDHPEQVRRKGEKALERIRTRHDPVQNARVLEALYDEITGGAGV